MKSYAISGTSAPAPREPAQDLSRHKPKAYANHLTQPEQVLRDAQNLEADVEALERMQARRPLLPPGRRP